MQYFFATSGNGALSMRDFTRLSVFISQTTGIKMPPEKRIMLQCRLQKRLKALNIPTFKAYCDYLFSGDGQAEELVPMIDVVCTNKTDFFREPAHFDYLQQEIFPQLSGGEKTRVWSAGCSSGEEVYSLAILFKEFSFLRSPVDFDILGTDISARMLKIASSGVYQEEKLEDMPWDLKKKYFLRSRDPAQRIVRIVDDLRSNVSFQRLNFMDNKYAVKEDFDIIFCRNVLIYFDRPTQERVINMLCSKLKAGGYFFLGHSESLMGMEAPLKQIKPTIFRKL